MDALSHVPIGTGFDYSASVNRAFEVLRNKPTLTQFQIAASKMLFFILF